MKGKGRMRDKTTVLNYCLKATILYRMQYCTWDIEKFRSLDRTMDKLIRKITKNMPSFPGGPIHADKDDGGLGIRCLTDEANERKLQLLKKIDDEDETGHAIRGCVSRGLRYAGKGGLVGIEQTVEDTLGDSIWITSVVQWLKEVDLDIRVNGVRKNIEYAVRNGDNKNDRIIMNKRGIVLRSEGDEGVEDGIIPLRVGQCWLEEGGTKVMDIVGFNQNGVEIIRWEGGNIVPGRRVKVSNKSNYAGYPTGMGSNITVPREYIGKTGKLVELSRDNVKGKEKKWELISGVSAREVTTLTGNLGSHVGGGGNRTPNLYDTGLVPAPVTKLSKPSSVTTRPRLSLRRRAGG